MDAKSRDKFTEQHAGKAQATAVNEAYTKATQEAIEYNRKALAIVQTNMNRMFECAQDLLDVRSPSEFVEVATKHARQQAQAMAEQTSELSIFAQKVLTNGIQPFTSGLGNPPSGTP